MSWKPPHWLCAACFDDGRKSISFDKTVTEHKGGPPSLVLDCPRGGFRLDTGYRGGSVERKYAEDLERREPLDATREL